MKRIEKASVCGLGKLGACIAATLAQRGFEVVGVVSGADDLFEHLYTSTPDVILMDIELKGEVTGLDIAAALKWQ